MRTGVLRAFLASAVAAAACGTPTAPLGGYRGVEAVQGVVEEIVDTMQQQ